MDEFFIFRIFCRITKVFVRMLITFSVHFLFLRYAIKIIWLLTKDQFAMIRISKLILLNFRLLKENIPYCIPSVLQNKQTSSYYRKPLLNELTNSTISNVCQPPESKNSLDPSEIEHCINPVCM